MKTNVINREIVKKYKSKEELINYLLNDVIYEGRNDFEESFDVELFLSKKDVAELSISNEIDRNKEYIGEVFGFGTGDTNYYYAFSRIDNGVYEKCGLIVTNEIYEKINESKTKLIGYDFFGTYDKKHNAWQFKTSDFTPMEIFTFDLTTNLYSRNEGLIEASEMKDKYVIINGCGSCGSLSAIELAKSGVGKFILIDKDILKLHNLCRHQLDGMDLGKYKVKALKEKILRINPKAEVITYTSFIEELKISDFTGLLGNGIMVSSADDRKANALANEIADKIGIPFVAFGCWTRAASGEVFYWEPNKGMKKYKDAFKGLIKDDIKRSNNYIGDEERGLVKFEPGTSIDISFVTEIANKVILDLLNIGSKGYTSRVINYLTNYTLICNTNDTSIGGEVVSIFPHPLYISDSIYLKEGD